MKKIFLFIIIGLFLINFSSAGLLDPNSEIAFHEEGKNGKYGYYEINDTDFWFFNNKPVKTIELIENDYSVFTAWNIKNIEVFKPTKLFDKTNYLDKAQQEDRKNRLSSELHFYREWEVKTRTINNQSCLTYETSENQTQVCSEWDNNSYEESYEEWSDWQLYNFQTVQEGLYQTKTIVTRENQGTGVIDWVDENEGWDLVEWATWWDNDWMYKRQLNITETSGSSLTNYSTLIYINYTEDTTSNANANFSDIRFLDSSETTELDYWIENKTDGSHAYIWVEVPTLTASSTEIIYMYYGNTGATSQSNGTNTFKLFDDFEYSDSTANHGWTLEYGSIPVTTTAENYSGLRSVTTASVAGFSAMYRGVSFGNTIMDARVKARQGAYKRAVLQYMKTGNSVYLGTEQSSDPNFVKAIAPASQTSAGISISGNWQTFKISYDGSVYDAYIDETHVGQSGAYASPDRIGFGDYWGSGTNPKIWMDDLRVRTYSSSEPTYIFGEEERLGATVNLISPADALQTTQTFQTFRCNASFDTNLTNLTFQLNGVDTLTNSTVGTFIDLTYSENITTEGTYNWSCKAITELNQTTQSSNRTLIIHFTAPTINISAPSGISDYFLLGNNETLIYNISETGQNLTDHLVDCWYVYSEVEVNDTVSNLNMTLTHWNIENGTMSSSGGINTVSLDFTFPGNARFMDSSDSTNELKISTFQSSIPDCINSNYTETSFYGSSNVGDYACARNEESKYFIIKLIEVNPTILVNDTFESYIINNDLNCSENTTNFTYILGQNNITVFAEDSFGLVANETSTWDYRVLEINQTFNNETTEGNLETFLATIRLGAGYSIAGAVLINYNESENIGQSFTSGDNTILRKVDFLVPNVEEDTNVTFYWNITLSDSTNLALSSRNQTIEKLDLDNCSAFTNQLLNMTVVDEEEQTILPNATIEIAVNIFDQSRTALVLNLSNIYEKINPLGICLNTNLTGNTILSMDTIIRYEEDDHANEYYNIVNLSLTNETETEELRLYDLNLNDSTEFQLSFTGADFLPVENALVNVDRQYISENTFKTVELPKTDYNGQTVLHLVRNDVIYNVRITKEGIILGNFENLVAFCDDFTIGDCNIELNAFDSVEGIFDYNADLGITFTAPEYNETIDLVSFNFVTSDGTAKEVILEVTRNDIFGNRSVCNSSLISSGGTLSCSIDPNLDETTLNTNVYVDGILSVKDSVDIDSSDYGEGGYLVAFVMIFSIMLFFIESKEGILISMGLSLASTIGLGLQSGNMTGLGASGIWLLIIIVIGIYKLNKDRPQ